MSFWGKLFGKQEGPSRPMNSASTATRPIPEPSMSEKPVKFVNMAGRVRQVETQPEYVDPAAVSCGFICFPVSMSKLTSEQLAVQALQTNKTELWKRVMRIKPSLPMHLITSNRDTGPMDVLMALDKLG
ncbi:MAG: hypothetical protein ABSC19_04520 [Syntrophorhabdales bacterium]|jgi:hypothetical protein